MNDQTNRAPEPTGTEYHYILTTQRPVLGGGIEIADARGALNITPGATRAEVLDYILGLVAEDRGWRPGEGSILFFALEPNQLGGAR